MKQSAGRPKSRSGSYERITLEVRKDILDFIDAQGANRREIIEEWGEQAMQVANSRFNTALEKFIASDEFPEALVSATKAAWGGDGYSVELFEDGTFRVLWDNQIGNLYETPGVILGLPTFDDEDYSALVNADENPMPETEYFSECYSNEGTDLADELRRKLKDTRR